MGLVLKKINIITPSNKIFMHKLRLHTLAITASNTNKKSPISVPNFVYAFGRYVT